MFKRKKDYYVVRPGVDGTHLELGYCGKMSEAAASEYIKTYNERYGHAFLMLSGKKVVPEGYNRIDVAATASRIAEAIKGVVPSSLPTQKAVN